MTCCSPEANGSLISAIGPTTMSKRQTMSLRTQRQQRKAAPSPNEEEGRKGSSEMSLGFVFNMKNLKVPRNFIIHSFCAHFTSMY